VRWTCGRIRSWAARIAGRSISTLTIRNLS